MNILFLTPQLPYPPRQGATIRNFNLIQRLAQRHQVDLLTFLAPGESLEPSNPLHSLCRRIGTARQPQRSLARRAAGTLFSPLPDMAHRLASPAMNALIDQAPAQAYELVQIEGIEMAPYGLRLLRRRADGSRPALVFDNHNCEYLLQKRNALSDLRTPSRWIGATYSLVQWQKLRLYERRVANASDLTVAVSGPDAQALARIGITAHRSRTQRHQRRRLCAALSPHTRPQRPPFHRQDGLPAQRRRRPVVRPRRRCP